MFILLIIACIILGPLLLYSALGGKGKTVFVFLFNIVLRITVIVLFPVLYLLVIDGSANTCCGDTATFSPEHKLTVYILFGFSVITYFISAYKKKILPPVPEILLNIGLIIGLILSVLIHIQIFKEWAWFASVFTVPISVLYILAIRRNHKLMLEYIEKTEITPTSQSEIFAWTILTSKNKFLYLILLCMPVLFLIASALILFGQKPDSMIRAFTDTYKHTFSQLDYECENVSCGGHFLCSVAANGHRNIVKPQRYGERLGKPIICNRQLLIANAFEDLIYQRTPGLHRIIRHNYNKIGDLVHKYYGIFSDIFVIKDTIIFMN